MGTLVVCVLSSVNADGYACLNKIPVEKISDSAGKIITPGWVGLRARQRRWLYAYHAWKT
jgi:hypothetical protein